MLRYDFSCATLEVLPNRYQLPILPKVPLSSTLEPYMSYPLHTILPLSIYNYMSTTILPPVALQVRLSTYDPKWGTLSVYYPTGIPSNYRLRVPISIYYSIGTPPTHTHSTALQVSPFETCLSGTIQRYLFIYLGLFDLTALRISLTRYHPKVPYFTGKMLSIALQVTTCRYQRTGTSLGSTPLKGWSA